MKTSNNRYGGFTLVELIVTISVAAILATIAVPSFQSMLGKYRLNGGADMLRTTVAETRLEAIRLGKRITICSSTDGSSCATTGDWSTGWVSFVDTTRDVDSDQATVDAGEELLKVELHQANVKVVGSTALANYISFASDGTPRTMAGELQTGKLRLCSSSAGLGDAARARDISLLATGLTRVETPSNVGSDCPSP